MKMAASVGVKVIAVLLLAISIAIAAFEYKKPSPKRWWRKVAESALTKFSANTRRPIGLSASKLAFKLRQSYSSIATVRQLAEAAERHEDYALSAVSKIYLARMSITQEEVSLQLAEEAFQAVANELTAWQYAAYLQHAGKPVPKEVTEVLLNGEVWEYVHLLRINAWPSFVSASVNASRGRIDDVELFQLARSATQSETEYAHWLQPEIQLRTIEELKGWYAKVEVVAIQDRGEVFFTVGLGDFFKRMVNGVAEILNDPAPMDIGTLASRSGRRAMVIVDALGAIGTAATADEKILKARTALGVLKDRIDYIESGEMVRGLEKEMTSDREALIARLDKLLSHPQRYWFSDSLVLASIEGKDPNELFLSEAGKGGATY